MFSRLGLLTCWSLGLGAQRCGPLGLCRARRGRNPLMPVAPRSRPGSSETGTWYQSCRCQKTADLREERLFVLPVGGSVGLFLTSHKEKHSLFFFLPPVPVGRGSEYRIPPQYQDNNMRKHISFVSTFHFFWGLTA